METRVADAAPSAPPPAAGDADSLAAILAAAAAGDGDAFAALFRRFAPVVHGAALARCGVGDAEDVVQEVFASVHRSLGHVRDPMAFPGFILAIAKNAATDRLRRRGRRPALLPLDDVAAREAPRGDGELRERVLARIQDLPEAYREPLVWRLVEGLGGPEIAERTGMTPASVRVNLCRGMALLRPLLEKDGWR